MNENYYNNSKDYINRWVISYADLVTLLLALFLVMYVGANKSEYSSNVDKIINTSVVNMPSLQKELINEFKDSKDILLLKDNRGLIIRLKGDIIFGSANAEIQPEIYPTLNKIIDILSKIDNPVIIEGHTDSFPLQSAKYKSNWELSTARATSVIDYLVNTKRINPRRLSAVGYGEYLPVAENTSNDGRMKNRRVDIIILNNNTGD